MRPTRRQLQNKKDNPMAEAKNTKPVEPKIALVDNTEAREAPAAAPKVEKIELAGGFTQVNYL